MVDMESKILSIEKSIQIQNQNHATEVKVLSANLREREDRLTSLLEEKKGGFGDVSEKVEALEEKLKESSVRISLYLQLPSMLFCILFPRLTIPLFILFILSIHLPQAELQESRELINKQAEQITTLKEKILILFEKLKNGGGRLVKNRPRVLQVTITAQIVLLLMYYGMEWLVQMDSVAESFYPS